MSIALRAQGLTKHYGKIVAVNGLDLEITAGTLYGFLGPNGAGKTTTIRMLLGLIRPTSGTVEVLGRPVVSGALGPGAPAREALRRVGALVEEPGFWRYLSGRRNLAYYARAAGPPDDRTRRLERVDEVLALVGLAGAADRKVAAYSQGMRQRLGIGRALLGDPELLVLDEPTNGLDPQGMREIRLLLRDLVARGMTVVVSSHLLAEVELLCDRVGVVVAGRIVAEGPPGGLLPARSRLQVEVADQFERATTLVSGLEGVSIIEANPAPTGSGGGLVLQLSTGVSASTINRELVMAGVEVAALAAHHESLEDAFLTLVEAAGA